MCVHESHLVLEALRDTDDQVVNDCTDRSEGSDVLSRTVVQFDDDDILLGLGEVDRQMVEVLGEFACSSINIVSVSLPLRSFRTSGTLNYNKSRLDLDLN